MKKWQLILLAAALLGAAALSPTPVSADGNQTWSSVIHYFNPNDVACAELNMIFYRQDGSAVSMASPLECVKTYESGSLLVGDIASDNSIRGGAILSSDVPMMALYKQAYTGEANRYSPILYTSFDRNQAGLGAFYIPSVQLTAVFDTEIGVQNMESRPIYVTVELWDESGGTVPVATASSELREHRSYVFRVSDLVDGEFHGSAVAYGTIVGGGNAQISAAAREIQANGVRAYGFEGSRAAYNIYYIPTAYCQVGDNQQTTEIIVQNPHDAVLNVGVQFFSSSRSDPEDTGPELVAEIQPHSVARHATYTINACDPEVQAITQGKRLAAVVYADNSMAVVQKVTSNDMLMTASTAAEMPSVPGEMPYRFIVPYVEWSTSDFGYRTTLSIMNLDPGNDAVNVKVHYYGRAGGLTPVATHLIASGSVPGPGPLPPYGMRTSNPNIANGVNPASQGFTGAAVVESDQPIAVSVRVQRTANPNNKIITLGDDYLAIQSP